jgi:hypothetical protein
MGEGVVAAGGASVRKVEDKTRNSCENEALALRYQSQMVLSGRLENMPLLDVLQVIAYSQRSGLLSVEGPSTRGTVLFQQGNVVCAHSTSTLSLLVKAAKEQNPKGRLALRRIQALVSLAELFDLKRGVYHFVRTAEPIPELAGLDMRPFYAAGCLDTGDLLLVLAKAMDQESEGAPPSVSDRPNQRRHPRIKPTVLRAELIQDETTMHGYVTDLSLGGAFFHAEQLPDIGSFCEVRINLPRDLGVCEASAKVVWFREGAPGAKRGVGLSFEELTEDSLERLSTYLSRFEKLAADMDSNV